MNFVGAGVTASLSGTVATVTVAGGGGGSSYVVNSVTTTYTATATTGTQIVLCDTTGGAFTVTLPTAVSNTATIVVKKIAGSPNLTVDGNASETIDGGLTATIVRVYESITLISNNSNWWIV
jgi:phage gp45-like